MYLIAFPLLLIPFVLYNMVVFLLDLSLDTALFEIPLLTGTKMSVSAGDTLILFAVLLLYLEILKATRLSTKHVMDHVLSLVLFVGMIAEFLLVERVATPTLLIMIALSFVDVIGGFTMAAASAPHDAPLERPEPVA